MNGDMLGEKWNQGMGRGEEWWGKLSDEDWDFINGDREQMIIKLQQHYGYFRRHADREINDRLESLTG